MPGEGRSREELGYLLEVETFVTLKLLGDGGSGTDGLGD